MSKIVTQEQRLHYMTTESLKKLVIKLAIPTIIANLITSLYNLADTYFVGLIGSESSTGAVGVIFPFMVLTQAFAFMFGQGSGNYISRELGAGRKIEAEKMAVTGFFSGIIFSIIMMGLGLFFKNDIVRILGATETITPFALDYFTYLLPGIPFLVCGIIINNQMRFQASAIYALIGISSGAIINIVLDPILIFHFNMGISGAALATSTSQIISFIILFLGTKFGGNIQYKIKNLSLNMQTYISMLKGGLPSLVRQGFGSVGIICLNVAASGFGDVAVAAMSITSRIIMFINSIILGFGQGFQPICGFNYGAKRYDRVYDCFWFCVKVSTIALLITSVLYYIYAPELISMFLATSPEVIKIGALSVRIHSVFLPLSSFIIFSNMLLQTLGLTKKASLLAMSRQGIFLIPTSIVLPTIFGMLGVQLAQPISDVCTALLSLPLSLVVLNNLKREYINSKSEVSP